MTTMTPTPKMTTAMASAVAGVTRSRSTTHDRSAANSGAAACISRMLATVVCCSATTKADDAVPKQTATPIPAQPMSRNILSVPRGPSRSSMNDSRNPDANTERQNTMAQELSVDMKRAMDPPKLQVIAAPATSRMPSLKSEECLPAESAGAWAMP